MADKVGSLPHELILEIGRHPRKTDLASLLLVNTHLNEVLTPLLYSDIQIPVFARTRECLRTLATGPDSLMYGRDLASLVRHFVVLDHAIHYPHHEEVEGRLRAVVPRLINVRELTVKTSAILTAEAVVDFLAASTGELQSFDVALAQDPPQGAQHGEVGSRSGPNCLPSLPMLVGFKLSALRGDPSPGIRSFRDILASRATQLQSLALSCDDLPGSLPPYILGSITSFPALTELDIQATTFFLSNFPHTAFPRLRALTIRWAMGNWRIDPADQNFGQLVPQAAYPALEELSCHDPEFLRVLLPENVGAHPRRRIHTACISEAIYDRDTYFKGVVPSWTIVREALSHLPYSGTPIRNLRFAAYECTFSNFADVASSLPGLESLTIVALFTPDFEDSASMARILGNTPRLHTLLFSEVLRKRSNVLYLSGVRLHKARQLKIIQSWITQAPALRHVAFTLASEWERRGEEWVFLDFSHETICEKYEGPDRGWDSDDGSSLGRVSPIDAVE